MKYPVLVPNIFNYPFTYESEIKLQVGDYVKVPFGKSVITGLVWNEFEKTKNKKFTVKKILEKINVKPLKKETINFLNLLSEYNLVPKGMCLKLHLLGGEAILPFDKKEYDQYNIINKKIEYKLSVEQKKILKEVLKNSKDFRVHLLQGTTGSGKTIVYFRTIEDKINQGLQALILLPEIGLTSEFEKKFKEFFGFNAAVWHSGITKKKKKLFGVVFPKEI